MLWRFGVAAEPRNVEGPRRALTMPVVSSLALRALARSLETPPMRVGLRRLFSSLLDVNDAPLLVERIAGRRPMRGVPDDGEAISFSVRPTDRREGPLAGESVVVKDSFDVAGVPSSLGLREHGPDVDADSELVVRLRAAGASLLGKGVMTELGIDGLGTLVPGGVPHNALAPGHVAGGSSTGVAVAVARGAARYGLGGDGLGSVRIPSALQGLVGLKPSHMLLPTRGYRSVAPSLDVPGPMARNAADCARLFQVLAALPVRPLAARAPRRVGIVRGLDPSLATRDVRLAFDRMLAALGVERETIDVRGSHAHGILAVGTAATEAVADHAALVARSRSGQARVIAAVGRALSPERDRIARLRADLRDACLRALDRTELFAMPTTAIPAPALRRSHHDGGFEPLAVRALGTFTPLANVTGLPAIAVPSGTDARGRSLSIMFVGPPGSEERLLSVALAVEATGLGARRV